jgi:hypothetical protein
MAPISYGPFPSPPGGTLVAHRITFRLLVILTVLLVAAFNGGWKWDGLLH